VAELSRQGNELVLSLSAVEKAESLHGDLRVPLSAVRGVEVLDDAHRAADIIGFRVGTRLARVVEVASVHGLHKTVFAAVHHSTPRGLRVLLEDQDYDEWVVGVADPEATLAGLDLAPH
jgi:hypothetical protein